MLTPDARRRGFESRGTGKSCNLDQSSDIDMLLLVDAVEIICCCRLCEICGETARNVGGGCDNRFMEEWNEGRWIDSNGREDGSRRRCLQGQPFCNLLMACLVIAFILPWFFRVNLF